MPAGIARVSRRCRGRETSPVFISPSPCILRTVILGPCTCRQPLHPDPAGQDGQTHAFTSICILGKLAKDLKNGYSLS